MGEREMTAGDLRKEKIRKKDGRYLYLYSWSRGGLDDEKADPRESCEGGQSNNNKRAR
jgi:hypothetical protein